MQDFFNDLRKNLALPGADAIDVCAHQYRALALAFHHVQNIPFIYFGDPLYKKEIQEQLQGVSPECLWPELKRALQSLKEDVDTLTKDVSDTSYRARFINAQLIALFAFAERKLQGQHLSFDEEVKNLYGTTIDESFYQESACADTLSRLNELLPRLENGSLFERFQIFRQRFVVPQEKYEALFSLGLQECRRRSIEHIPLPHDEKCESKFMEQRDQTFEAYVQYHGSQRSEVLVNLALPCTLDKYLQLPAHEAYPGHHLFFCVIEKELVRKKGWIEFSFVSPFSPYALISEGAAEYGAMEVLWAHKNERVDFMADLWGKTNQPTLSKADLELWDEIAMLTNPLDLLGRIHIGIAKKFIDEEISRDEAMKLMEESGLRPNNSWPNIGFIEQYGAYIITYSWGKHLIKSHLERRAKDSSSASKWATFSAFLVRPPLPSDMI